MKYVYPAIFTEENGNYLVSVPDLPGCHTFGSSLGEAIEMSRDAAAMWLCMAEDRKEEIPAATMNINPKEGFVSYIDVDTIEYRRINDNKAVKKTLTIPSWLNAQAELSQVNFSAVLQKALMEQLNINR